MDAHVRELLDATLDATEPSLSNVRAPVRPDSLNSYLSPDAADVNEPIPDEQLALLTLDSIGDAVICMNAAGNVSYLNPVAEALTGWPQAEIVGRPFNDVLQLIDDTSREAVRNPMRLAIENDAALSSNDCTLIRRDGAEIAIDDSVAPLHDRSGKVIGAVMVFRDVSAARAIAIKMAYLAQHDVLTGLPNRMLLFDRLGQAIGLARRHNQPFALIFVDIDRFKYINDAFGHSVGDRFLTSIAERLRSCVRGTDTVSRLGGDEFVVLLSEITYSADAIVCADKINQELRMPYVIEQQHFRLTASIGVCVYPKDGRDAESLLRNADSAMMHAKRNGGDRIQLYKSNATLRAMAGQPGYATIQDARYGR